MTRVADDRAVIAAPESRAVALAEAWEDAPGGPGFLSTVDHKRIGMRYLYTSVAFFLVSGVLALLMRLQLAQPESELFGPETFNQIFTMHGTTMIFLFNTPILAGFGNYLVPLMIGTRDMAFPRLNAFSYWIFLFAGIFMYAGFLFGGAPDGGWFAYAPLTSEEFSPGTAIDYWGIGVVFVGVSTTVGAVNFIVTAFKLRAPGMTLTRIPVFVWSMLVFSFMVVFAVPAVTLGAGLLEMDRIFGTAFFEVERGGSALLYQHLFWFWGHPEVYILFIPAVGMVSMIIPVAARRRLVGYVWVVASLIAIGFISFGVWVHHMFSTGVPVAAMGLFSAVSLVIAIPSAVLFFAWIATMAKGAIAWSTPMLFCLGFLLIFLLGGITGVMVSVLPFDWQAHDSYFVVGHFHYVLNGAVVFPVFGALHFWFPKMTGRMLPERLGRWSFWTMFIGFNLAFFPMHILGFLGMPRRIYTYADGLGWGTLNLVVTAGSFVFAAGVLLSVIAFVHGKLRGPAAPADPWRADSLEWAVSSPPPHYNFAAIPVVDDRHALWSDRLLRTAEPGGEDATVSMGTDGAMRHETPVTTGSDARPHARMRIPADSALPFWSALGLAVLVGGLLAEALLVGVLGVAVAIVAILRWLWLTDTDLPHD